MRKAAAVFTISLVLLMALGAACAGAEPTPTPTRTATVTATPTATPTATATTTPTPVPGLPASVQKVTVAWEEWQWEELAPPFRGTTCGPCRPFHVNLFNKDEDGKIVPGLALEWKMDPGDATRQMYKIRKDARFHNGDPVTPEDVKWSLDAFMGKVDHPDYKGVGDKSRYEKAIDRVSVEDDWVVVHTKGPQPIMCWDLMGCEHMNFRVTPAKYMMERSFFEYENNPVGTGPYTLESRVLGERYLFERWEEFWADTDYLHKPQHRVLAWVQVRDINTRKAMLLTEQADVITHVPPALAREFRDNPRTWVKVVTGTGLVMIVFPELDYKANIEPGPYSDFRVRKALALAIDRKAIEENVHFGFYPAKNTIYHVGAFGYRPEVGEDLIPYDPAEARRLLAEAGYPNGFSTTLWWTVSSSTPGADVYAEAVGAFWDAIGVKTMVQYMASNAYYVTQAPPKRNLRPVHIFTWGRQEEASIMVTRFRDCLSLVCLPVPYDELGPLADKVLGIVDSEERKRIIAQVEDIVLENLYVIPTYQASMLYALSERVAEYGIRPGYAYPVDFHRIVAKR